MSVTKHIFLFALAWVFVSGPQAAVAGSSYVPKKQIMTVGVLKDSPPLAFSNKNEKVREVRGLAVDLALMLNHYRGTETVFRLGSTDERNPWVPTVNIN